MICTYCYKDSWRAHEFDLGVAVCNVCGFQRYVSKQDVPDKNTDNLHCVTCGRETKPLFHLDRYCPQCEDEKKSLSEADLEDFDWSNDPSSETRSNVMTSFEGIVSEVRFEDKDYYDSPCDECGDDGCSGDCHRFD